MKRLTEVIKEGEAFLNGIGMFLDCDEDGFEFGKSFGVLVELRSNVGDRVVKGLITSYYVFHHGGRSMKAPMMLLKFLGLYYQ